VSQAGGDFYDLVEFPDGSFGFAQVDVSGHGVASAMIGAMFKMVFHSLARDVPSPARLLCDINDSMFDVLPDSDFLTVFYGIVDSSRRHLVFCNAGHTKPFLYRAASGDIEELDLGGPLIGAFPGMIYDEGHSSLNSGDKILVFTDGITETRRLGTDQDFYGEARLGELLRRHADLRASEIIKRVMDDLEEFSGGAVFEDDVTMMLVGVT
jgi:phosphoserine phosphatase RsbU/P